MPVITIDNKKIEVTAGTTVLKAALENGIYIPHYCWHPLLSISGNCRMCVVEIEGRPKLEVSCNLAAADGMVVKTDTPAVKKMRKSVLEFLLINHPIDCPICDQAGECLLQDYHFKYSGQASRFKEEKVHKSKVVDAGQYIKLDNERCILCTRCVRFCQEVVKEPELTVAIRGDRSFITTAPGKTLDNPYSLNTVDICPVGALTSKDFRFKKRVWFLKSTPSVCPHCSNGCPIWIDHADGIMYRWRPRQEIEKVNGIASSQLTGNTILCDEGRLSYGEWQSDTKISKPLMLEEGEHKEISRAEAVLKLNKILSKDMKEIIAVLSAQISCEEADAFVKFLREKAGTDKIYRSGRMPLNPTSDDIIRKADKNPNAGYLEKMGLRELPANIEGDVLFVTDSLSKDDILKTANLKWKSIVQITHDKRLIVPGAEIILPRATFAESEGTFVNFNGVKRKFSPAFKPAGEARTIAGWIPFLEEGITGVMSFLRKQESSDRLI
ncbi:MAG: (2Fe-2S)-binding protein [Deltaproteobacteria bacterium]|nr:(2Fe-2S)-binding protein [Deltaproteobacteria bacterium]